jgi:hypothetical protein
MKQALGVAALAAVADATVMSSYSRKRVNQTRNHLEKVYGKGLLGMFDSDGVMTHDRLGWARRRPHSIWVEVGGVQVDAETTATWFYGFAQGLQYTAMASSSEKEPVSNCFYALYGFIDTADNLLYGWKNIFSTPGQINWFNAVFYDPLHATGDFSVIYEYCNGY